jgi:hypothetical protein
MSQIIYPINIFSMSCWLKGLPHFLSSKESFLIDHDTLSLGFDLEAKYLGVHFPHR